MNNRQKFALACSFLGFVVASVCLHHTTPLTMMAFFSGALPLFALGIGVYAFDILKYFKELRDRSR